MEYQDIIVTREGAVATIAVNRPAVLNAIRYETMVEIQDVLDGVAKDDAVRVVVLTGAGDKAFVAGGDISIMAKGSGYLDVLHTLPAGQQITWNIEHFPKPVIARINGIALGGGTELALCCDIRVAADTAVMGLPEINLGIIPGYGGTQRLPRIVGAGMAKRLILTGEHISAQEAYRIGLVDMVVPKAELDEAVAKLAARIASKGPIALAMAKEAVNMGLQADLRTGLSIEARCFCLCFGSEDRIEGMKAFLEKRKPEFKGK
ncbi:MAG TPA: enoyl-CoA hydratase-related protein [Syntrophales bacterium]|nr:enoyl-CoA hydratase-related protein [Syntrophales bacterium]HOM07556.1 enoyl-CoA hydratase-related protein [Syntrophales bacterium]HOO00092.1 enoyl-CoA hydratase-related protein [Syntrophales bacterium]